MRRVLLALFVAFLAIAPLEAKGSGHSSGRSTTKSTHAAAPKAPRTSTHQSGTSSPKASTTRATQSRKAPVAVARDNEGRIKRSEVARHAFEVQTGYPHGRPGYVIDHIRPLACGGTDDPSNMQWQTIADAKAKDRVERKGC